VAQEVSIPRQRIAEGSLPPICLICGNAAPHRCFAKIGAPSLAWIFVAPLIGLLAFWISVLTKDPPHWRQRHRRHLHRRPRHLRPRPQTTRTTRLNHSSPRIDAATPFPSPPS